MTSSPRHLGRGASNGEDDATKSGGPPPLPRARAHLKRRWPRRALIGVNALVLVCLLAVGGGYAYVRYEIDRVKVAPSHGATPEGCFVDLLCKRPNAYHTTGGLRPENILLIGNQTRQGLTYQQQLQYGFTSTHSGSLADIMMVLHLDPTTDTASILSVPRDLFAPMPAGSLVGPYQKMDAALNNGPSGPENLMNAIQEDLGIPINHFVMLNFNGFINIVNALGGINAYFPEPVWDAESLLYVTTPGCHHLNGTEALALVRARHLQYEPPGMHAPRYDWPQEAESDLARIVRTHTFMKIVTETALHEGKTNLLAANSFLNAVIPDMTVDQGLKNQMLSLVLHYRHINPNAVKETTLPTAPVNSYYYGGYAMGDVLFPVQPADNNVIKAWDPQAFPTPVPPKSVSVVSLTGSTEAAASAGEALASDGLKVVGETAGSVPASTTVTWVDYRAGDLARALYVMKFLKGAVMLQRSTTVAPGTVQVELGSTVTVASKPAASTPTSTSASPGSSSTTTSAPEAPRTATSRAAASSTTTVPTPGGIAPSAAGDVEEPWDPRACPATGR
jgi:LCP family protein required for cell wall assembly